MTYHGARYALGFVFDSTLQNVILTKQHGFELQNEKYNGIGGIIKKNEIAKETIKRICVEKTGVVIDNWKPLIAMYFSFGTVDVFCATIEEIKNIKVIDNHHVAITPIKSLPLLHITKVIVSNLMWLIPLSVWLLEGNSTQGYTIHSNWQAKYAAMERKSE